MTATGTCAGHHADDTVPGVVFAARGSGVRGAFASLGAMSHAELRGAIDPTGARMAYVYDNFAWPHCEAEGYEFQLPSAAA